MLVRLNFFAVNSILFAVKLTLFAVLGINTVHGRVYIASKITQQTQFSLSFKKPP